MISVITPVDKRTSPFLEAAHQSLKQQTHEDWEWLVGFNGGADATPLDWGERVRFFNLADDEGTPHNRIGRLKHELCDKCSGDIIVELDADDILERNALGSVQETFTDKSAHFAYSNFVMFQEHFQSVEPYSSAYGWQHIPVEHDGHALQEHVAFPPTVHSMRRVEWAPNHVRAWRADSYYEIGGHDSTMLIGDDHDLLCRTYLAFGAKGMRHIDAPLYLYRCGGNTSEAGSKSQKKIMQQVAKNYIRYIEPMVVQWCRESRLPMFDLGCGRNPKPEFVGVDKRFGPLRFDLNRPWPFADSSVGALRAHHVLEHLDDLGRAFEEAYRVLAPGGWMLMEYPSSDGKGAFRDYTHKQFINEQTLWYFTNRRYADFTGFTGRFQLSRSDVYLMEPGVPVVAAELICLKPPYDQRPVGQVLI